METRVLRRRIKKKGFFYIETTGLIEWKLSLLIEKFKKWSLERKPVIALSEKITKQFFSFYESGAGVRQEFLFDFEMHVYVLRERWNFERRDSSILLHNILMFKKAMKVLSEI